MERLKREKTLISTAANIVSLRPSDDMRNMAYAEALVKDFNASDKDTIAITETF